MTQTTPFYGGLAERTYFLPPSASAELRLAVVLLVSKSRVYNSNFLPSPRLSQRAGTTFTALELWFFVPSPATKRAGRPRVLTTSTQTPTTSCACCTSKGGKTSRPPRYGEPKALKGPGHGISSVEPSQAWHSLAGANNRTSTLPLQPVLLCLLSRVVMLIAKIDG